MCLFISIFTLKIYIFLSVQALTWCYLCCILEAWIEKPSYGKPLEEHLTLSGRDIAFPIEACVTMLLECGMQEEVRTCRLDRISAPDFGCVFHVCLRIEVWMRGRDQSSYQHYYILCTIENYGS